MKQALIVLVLLQATPAAAADVPGVRTTKLDNGLVVMLRPDSSVPLVAVEVRCRGGGIYDPATRGGVAGLTATLMMYGTPTRTEDEISDQIAMLGAALGTASGTETLAVGGDVPTIEAGALDSYLEILADVLLRPTFPAAGFERARKRRLGQLEGLVDNRGALAGRALKAWLFHDHPYGRATSGTLASVKSLTRDDVVAFHRANLVPADCAVGLAGDFDAEVVTDILRERLGAKAWKKPAVERADPWANLKAAPRDPGVRILLIDTGDETLNQAQIRLGLPLRRTYADANWLAYHLASQVLGGDFTARLNARLRVKEGLTYGARWRSEHDDVVPGAGYLSTYTSPRDVARALRITMEEIGRFRTEPIPEAELERVKQRIVRGFVFRFETADDVLGEHLDLWQENLPITHLSEHPERVAAMTGDALKAVLSDFPDKDYAVVVVGNRKLVPDLQKYANEAGGTLEVKRLDYLGLLAKP